MDTTKEICGPMWLRILATIVGTISSILNWMMLMAIAPVLSAVYTDSNTDIAIVYACKYFVQMLSNPIAAFLVHRYGPWPTGLLGLFGYMISLMVFGVTEHLLWMLALMMCLQGFSGACMFNGTQAAMVRHYPKEEQGFGVSFCMFGLSLGLFLGPIWGGVMYDLVGYFWTFYIIVIVVAAVLVLGCITAYFALYVYDMPGAAYDKNDKGTQISETQFMYNFFVDAATALAHDARLLNFFVTFSTEIFLIVAVITVESFYLERNGWSASYTGLAVSTISAFYGLISLVSGSAAASFPLIVQMSPYPSLLILGAITPLIGLYSGYGQIFGINFACGIFFGIIEAFGVFNYRFLLKDSPLAFTLTDITISMGGVAGSLAGGILNDNLSRTVYALGICGGIAGVVGLVTTIVAVVFLCSKSTTGGDSAVSEGTNLEQQETGRVKNEGTPLLSHKK